jgi:hypothetical protein
LIYIAATVVQAGFLADINAKISAKQKLDFGQSTGWAKSPCARPRSDLKNATLSDLSTQALNRLHLSSLYKIATKFCYNLLQFNRPLEMLSYFEIYMKGIQPNFIYSNKQNVAFQNDLKPVSSQRRPF